MRSAFITSGRNVGLGSEHGWSSHAADALGLNGDLLRGAGQGGELQPGD
jgi:hypothetical protein